MSTTTRVPAVEITGLYGAVVKWFSKRMLGKVPSSLGVLYQNPAVLKFSLGIGQKTSRWHACDEDLKSYAHMAVAALVGCSWCLDFGYFKAHNDGLDLAKVREVPRWRDSDVFTETERAVLEYAEAMSTTPLGVTDEMVAGLIDRLGVEAVVELTQMVALENMRSRFNSAAGLQSQGYSDVCELPLAVPSAT